MPVGGQNDMWTENVKTSYVKFLLIKIKKNGFRLDASRSNVNVNLSVLMKVMYL